MDYQLITLISNLGALTVAGIIYSAYIKNIRSQIALKSQEIKVVESNLKFYKDKVVDLERHTPQFIEQQLSSRIKIREDEVKRLAKDGEANQQEIDKKSSEIDMLKQELEATKELSMMLTVWDSKSGEYKSIPHADLTIKNLGSVWINTATLMVCDPWHIQRSVEREREDHPMLGYRFQYKTTGEIQTVESDEVTFEVDELEGHFTAKELVAKGLFRELSIPTSLPAEKESYIKGQFKFPKRNKTVLNTFDNGDTGAGICVGLGGDGAYQVSAEFYDEEIRRIVIDL